jgi:hypothetical protein
MFNVSNQFSGRFGQNGSTMPEPPAEVKQMLEQQLASKGATLDDFKAVVQQTGDPRAALQQFGLTPPGLQQSGVGSNASKFGQNGGNLPEIPPQVKQMLEQQLASKGLTVDDVKAEAQKTGDPIQALQNLGIQAPSLNQMA